MNIGFLADLEAVVGQLSGLNLPALWTELRSLDLKQELNAADTVAGVVAKYIPGAVTAEQAIRVAEILVTLAPAMGLRPVAPGDAAYSLPDRGQGAGA